MNRRSDIDLENLKKKILKWNDNDASYFENKYVHQLVEKQVNLNPNKLAIQIDNIKLTYEELNNASNQLAYYLKRLEITNSTRIGIYFDTSVSMIIALLATLKSGYSYVPIDYSYPIKRIEHMLNTADIKFVITQSNLKKYLPAYINCVDINTLKINPNSHTGNHTLALEKKDEIYTLFTSGSTGKPKATPLYNKAVCNLLSWYSKQFNFNTDDKILIISSFSFDLTQKNILGGLISGASIHLIAPRDYDVLNIRKLISKKQITLINCTPSAFYPIVEDFNNLRILNSLRYVFLGGEPIITKRLKEFTRACPKTNIVNTYGPTECTDITCIYTLKDEDITQQKNIPVGYPIQNVKVLILNEKKQLVPPDIVGEVYIGGIGVGGGYLKDEALTKEKFIKNPFTDLVDNFGAILYRVGDLAKWRSDGTIEYIGRIDNQIKLRGYRIELNEIEKIAIQHKDINEAVAIADEDTQSLILFYTKSSNNENTNKNLKNHLLYNLPSFMVPARIIQIKEFPLNPNRKIDRVVLKKKWEQKYKIKTIHSTRKTSATDVLRNIWSSILNIKENEIDPRSNFIDLGGYSLLAVKICNEINKVYSIDLSIKDFFLNSTIEKLEVILKNKLQENEIAHQKVTKIERITTGYPLTLSQLQVWNKYINTENPIYTLVRAYTLDGELDENYFLEAISEVVHRHTSFRCFFNTNNNKPIQKLLTKIDSERFVSIDNISHMTQEKCHKYVNNYIKNLSVFKFNINKWPLFKIKLIKLSPNSYVFVFAVHHIVFDGWSWGIFKNEINHIYNAKLNNQKIKLPTISLTYHEYAQKQHMSLSQENIEKSYLYWLKCMEFKENHEKLFQPREIESNITTCDLIKESIPSQLYYQLNLVAKNTGVTLFNLLFTAFNLSLYLTKNYNKYIIFIPIAGRDNNETNNITGMFTHSLPVKSYINDCDKIHNIIETNKYLLLELLNHRFYPFQELLENHKKNDLEIPKHNLMFSFQNSEYMYSDLSLNNIKSKAINISTCVSSYILEWEIWPENDSLLLEIKYRSPIDTNTIALLVSKYKEVLKSFCTDDFLNKKIIEIRHQPSEATICD